MLSHKQSKYNYLLRIGNNSTILFNFFSRSLVVLNENELYRLNEKDKLRNEIETNSEFFTTLKRLGFIIKESTDEIEYIKKLYYKSLNKNALVTIVLPTLRCNFNCPYCFEIKRNSDMNMNTIESYLKWVEANLPNMEHFHITWFGGEPLLRFDIIEYLSKKAIKLTKDYGCGYSASITTNGYLLKENIFQKFSNIKLNNVHVTLDGSKHDHNMTRATASGKASYGTICKNIEKYCDLSRSHLPLSIRVNVTDENIDRIPNLFSDFSDTVKHNSRMYFRWVWTSEASGYKVFSSNKEYPYEKLGSLYEKAHEAGFYIDNPIDEFRVNYCEVDFRHHYSIDPEGYIYLCAKKYLVDESFGNVKNAFSPKSVAIHNEWININPFSDDECLNCKMLPLCNGGCRKSRYNGIRACIEEKSSIDNYIMNIYRKELRKKM